jgi:hypothetical protein
MFLDVLIRSVVFVRSHHQMEMAETSQMGMMSQAVLLM